MGVIWMDSVMDMRKPVVAIAFTIFLSSHPTVAANCQQRGQSTGGGEILGTLLGAALGGLIGSQIGSVDHANSLDEQTRILD